jgi:hypothetical protein
MMGYQEFLLTAREKGFTGEQLRCDVPVTPELLEFMVEVGLDRYERFMNRLDREAGRMGRVQS